MDLMNKEQKQFLLTILGVMLVAPVCVAYIIVCIENFNLGPVATLAPLFTVIVVSCYIALGINGGKKTDNDSDDENASKVKSS